jgi:diguanylate cyclase (GGDEF)-like protein
MQAPPIPLDEARRVSAVRALGLLDTPAEERFDRVTRLAMRLFGASAATLSLIDESREWIKSAVGFPFEQLSRRASFAAHAIGTGEMLLIEDAASDARFSDHPLVTSERRFRGYAGEPLHAGSGGSQVAVLSIYSEGPLRLGAADRQALSDLASLAERELRAGGLSAPQIEVADAARRTESPRVDPLTRLWNRTAMFDIVRRELDEARASQTAVAFLIIDVPPPRVERMPNGDSAGDFVLVEVARVLRASLRPYDVIARFAGQEFAALLTNVDPSNALDAAERVRMTIAREIKRGTAQDVDITVGVTTASALASDPESLVRAAQAALWTAKTRGGNHVGISSHVPAVPDRAAPAQ